MIGRLLAVLLVLGALGGFVLAEMPALRAVSGERDIERVRAYELGLGADPTFAVEGGDRMIRLVTNALVTAEAGGADVDYAIAVGIRRPGQDVEERTLYLRSHRSGPLTGEPDPCFDARGTPIADPRHVDLPFEPPAPPGTLVSVRAVGPIRSLVRAWSRQPRASAARAERLLALYPELRERIGESIGIGAWDHLRAEERAALTENQYKRLAAVGGPGDGYALHDFYARAAEAPIAEAATPPTDLSRPVTWILNGPAEVTVRVALAGADAAGADVPVHLRDRMADAGDLALFRLAAGDPEATWSGKISPGLHTLELVADGPGTWSVDVVAPGTAQVPPLGDAAPIHVGPSVSRLLVSPIGPDETVSFDAEAPSNGRYRMLEIETWGATERDPLLTLRTVARSRSTVDQLQTELAENRYDRWVDETGAVRSVRGPQRVKIVVPTDAVRVEVSASAPAFVRLRVPFHAADDAEQSDALAVRSVGIDDGPAARSWVRPLGDAPQIDLLVYGRMELVPPPPPPPTGWYAHTLTPSGFVPRFESLEKVSSPFPAKVLTEVAAGRPVVVRASDTNRASARWSYEVQDLAWLGTSVPLFLDGADAGQLVLGLSRGTYRLPPLGPGEHTVSAAPPAGVRLFVNVPPANPAAGAYRARTVWPVGPGGIDVPVWISKYGPKAVDVVLYDRYGTARPDVEIAMEIDRGSPRLRDQGPYTRATPPRRTYTLPAANPGAASARLLDGSRTEIGLPRTLYFPLGDDLDEGSHVLRIRTSRPSYARFFVLLPPGNRSGKSPVEAADE